MTTGDDSVTYPTPGYGVLTPFPAYVVNIQDVPGADPTGNDDSTLALQTALDSVPDTGGEVVVIGIYKISATLYVKSNTTISGAGTIKAAITTAWPSGSPYYGISNLNHDADEITDENITIRNLTIDYTECLPYDGTQHCIYIRKAQRVVISGVTVIGGSDSVALLGCDDTQEIGNRYLNFTNCGSDHWDGPSNGRLIGCHLETDVSAQMVNWNPDPTTAPSTGYAADGFVMIGNTLVSHEASATPCQIEPLRADATVRNVTVTGNTFVNVWLVFRGDVAGLVVTDNVFSGFESASEVITGYTNLGGTPAGVVIANNVIRDPLTDTPSLGVIRMESDTASMLNNIVLGSAYTVAPFYRGSSNAQRFGNYAESTDSVGVLKNGFYVENGSAKPIGWTDASGTRPEMVVQSDNNWIFRGTDSSGAARTALSLFMRSSSSELTASIPWYFSSTYRTAITTVAAAGTVIATATVLTGNVHNVTTCTAGVADGVALTATTGRPQTVINSTADTLKVYPNNGGSAQIDAGGVNIPTTIAAGKAKTFVLAASADFRTIAAT